jgi:hypothetical protein
VRHPRQARHHHAEGHPACAEDTRRVGGRGVDLSFCRMVVFFWLVGAAVALSGWARLRWAGLGWAAGLSWLRKQVDGWVDGGRFAFRYIIAAWVRLWAGQGVSGWKGVRGKGQSWLGCHGHPFLAFHRLALLGCIGSHPGRGAFQRSLGRVLAVLHSAAIYRDFGRLGRSWSGLVTYHRWPCTAGLVLV